MKTFLTILISVTVGFLIGYIPMALGKAELKGQLKACDDRIAVLNEKNERTEASAGCLNSFIGAYEATWNKNFGIAQTRASEAFDKAKIPANKGIEPFASVVGKRDEIIAALAKGDRDAEPKLRLVLFALFNGE
jgi:hypothetical protein